MRVALLATGTELTRGELVNTNTAWLAARLVAHGIESPEHRIVDDDDERILGALRGLAASFDAVLVTGGLGPTTDDRTAAIAAQALGVPLETHAPSLDAIRAYLEARGRQLNASNAKQAELPVGSRVLVNRVGTAPGFAIELGASALFFMPGVPREMEAMFLDQVLPVLAQRVTRTTQQLRLRTFGLPESIVGDRLAGLEDELPGLTIGYRASFPEVEVKVHARARTAAEADALAEHAANQVRRRLGPVVYGDESDSFAAHVGRTLRDRGLTLALAESCTGGLVGEMITSIPGSSDYLLFGAITYSNAAKIEVLGVREELVRAYGAVSAEVAGAMAEGALRVGKAAMALSITGVAGPGGGTPEKPVGTVWLGLARRDFPTETRLARLHGSRDRIRTMAAYEGLQWVASAAQGTRA